MHARRWKGSIWASGKKRLFAFNIIFTQNCNINKIIIYFCAPSKWWCLNGKHENCIRDWIGSLGDGGNTERRVKRALKPIEGFQVSCIVKRLKRRRVVEILIAIALAGNNTNRHIVDRPRHVCGGLGKLARTVAFQLIAWTISRHYAVDEWLGIWNFCGRKFCSW